MDETLIIMWFKSDILQNVINKLEDRLNNFSKRKVKWKKHWETKRWMTRLGEPINLEYKKKQIANGKEPIMKEIKKNLGNSECSYWFKKNKSK